MKNKDLLAGVYEVERPIKMCTNTGTRIVSERGEMLGMKCDPWLDKDSMSNIISFAELKDQYRITYDSKKADSFFVIWTRELLSLEERRKDCTQSDFWIYIKRQGLRRTEVQYLKGKV